MSESSSPQSLRRPAALSVGLLVLGVTVLGAVQTGVVRHLIWDQYRANAATRAKNMARFAAENKPWPFPPLDRPTPLRAREVLGYATYTGLTILLIGLLVLTLIAVGRRRLWLPIALGGLCLGQATLVTSSYADWASWVGVAASLVVVAVAAVPLLVAGRGRRVEHRPIVPASLGSAVVLGVLAVDWVWVQHYNGPVQPRPAPTLALLFAAALLVASPLRRAWLPVLLLGTLLAVPELQEPLNGLEVSGWHQARIGISQYQVGPLLFTLGVAVAGGLIGRYGAQALESWRALVGRGPTVHVRRPDKAPASA